jgi:hypothetical protein
MPLLEKLDISGCYKVTPEGLRAAVDVAAKQQLKVLVIGLCNSISEKTAIAIKEAFPSLRVLYARAN